MKFSAKVRFLFGIAFVIALVAVLAILLTISMSTSHSVKATLDAQARSIGTDYSGLVVKQNIEEGQTVQKGDVLFEIDSQTLKQSLNNGTLKSSSLGFSLNPDNNNIQLKANNSGVIDKIFFREGAYVPASAVVATEYVVDSLFVNAHFQLSPQDYARIKKDQPIDLLFPDNSTKSAEITSVNLESSEKGNSVDTVIVAKVKNADMGDFRFSVGTPVDATLHLNQDAWYQNVITLVKQLFTPKGS